MSVVFITGGAGFIGSHLCDRLLAEGHRVIAVDDLTTGRIANLGEARGYGKEFTFYNMDIRNEGLRTLFERHRPEFVMHLASQAGVRPSLEDPAHDASVALARREAEKPGTWLLGHQAQCQRHGGRAAHSGKRPRNERMS